MIFVTVSKDFFFERLIKRIDEVSVKYSLEMVVQGGFDYAPKSTKISYYSTMDRSDFDKFFNQAQLVISHAGIGNIISAKQKRKPAIIVPRLKKFKEHCSDHQLEIAKKLEDKKGFKVVYDVNDLDSLDIFNFSEKPEAENVNEKKAIINEVRCFLGKYF